MNDIEVGQEFYGVVGKLIIDPNTNRRRVISVSDQLVPEGKFIECSKPIRKKCNLGTLFKLDVGVSRKPTGRIYLHSLRKNELLEVSEYDAEYGI